MSEPFFIDDDDRYGRLRLIPWWSQDRLSAARILVVGAGALGNEVLKNLALVGVGTVYVVDCDTIEPTNLSRSILFRGRDRGRPKAEVAAEALRELNPDIRVAPLVANVLTDIGLGLFRHVDLVVGCLDNREARLWVNRQCWKTGRPWIDGGIQEINGVVKVFVPPDSACYECAMTDNDYQLIRLRYSCPLLSRDDIQSGKVPTAPTIASMIAGLQVQEALKWLHGLPVAAGQAHIFNGVATQFYTTAFQRREDCLSHETYRFAHEVPLSAARHTARQLFSVVGELTGDCEGWILSLDRDLVVSLDCLGCQSSTTVLKPASAPGLPSPVCPTCGQTMKPQLISHVSAEGDPLANETLARLGIPAFDILRVASPTQECHVLLAADRGGVVI